MPEALVEQVVSMPVINPDSGAASRTFEYAGKVDMHKNATAIDWKGTSNPARFIQRATIGCQAECYALALRYRGVSVTQIEYRLIQRPALQFGAPKFKFAVKKEGRKSAVKVCEDRDEAEALAATLDGGWVEQRITGDKDRHAYEERCLEQMREQPQRVVSHPHFLTESRLELARVWLWQCCKRILECRQHDRWLPNDQACHAYERDCPYIPLCEAIADSLDIDNIIDRDYETVDAHPELDEYKGEKEVVTYSSLSVLGMCEVRYFWKHEKRLRKRREHSEPLWIGSAMHRGMEVYATDGLDAALAAIDKWAKHNPIIGADQVWQQDQQIARARAMCRAAAEKWKDNPKE